MHSLRALLNSCPSLPIACGVLSGILPYATAPGGFRWQPLMFTAAGLSFLAFFSRKDALKFAAGAILSWLLTLHCLNPSAANFAAMIPGSACGAEIEAVVRDAGCADEKLLWLAPPAGVMAEVSRMRYADSSTWMDVSGRTILFLPRGAPHPSYGRKFSMEGAFMEPDTALFPGDFNYRNYLLANGIRMIFRAEKCEAAGTSPGPVGHALRIRDFLLGKMTEYVSDDGNKALLAGIFFGCRQGSGGENRRIFLLSGTIHIMAVSGFNIGMLAVLFFWLLRWMPFTSRHLAVPFLLMAYVVMTGMQPSAVRALMMIGIWSFQRAFFYHTSPLNAVFLAASLIMLWNPMAVLDSGFQFSFIVTGFLIVSWRNALEWLGFFAERTRWVPWKCLSTQEILKLKLSRLFLSALFTTVCAWLASAGLSLYNQGIFIPEALLSNFAIVPSVWMIFTLAMADALLFWLPWISPLLGSMMELLLSFTKEACVLTAGLDTRKFLPQPGVISVLLFYASLAAAAGARSMRVLTASVILLGAVICSWYLQTAFRKPSVAVVYGGDAGIPCIAIYPPSGGAAAVANIPSKAAARAVVNSALRRGIAEVGTLAIAGASKEYCAGAPALFSGLETRMLLLPESYRRSASCRRTADLAFEESCETRLIPQKSDGTYATPEYACGASVASKPGCFSISYKKHSFAASVKCNTESSGICNIEIESPGSANISIELKPSNRMLFKEVGLGGR